jgi:3-oxoacyl-[acyl-carrier-protein] synthase-3
MTSRGRCIGNFGDGAGAAVLVEKKIWLKGSCLRTYIQRTTCRRINLRHQEWVVVGYWYYGWPRWWKLFSLYEWPIRFKNAVVRFSEVINEALEANNLSVSNIDMLIPHQANLRISQFIQKKFDWLMTKFIIIFKNTVIRLFYSNCLNWSLGEWKIKTGDTVVLAAWKFYMGSAIIKW